MNESPNAVVSMGRSMRFAGTWVAPAELVAGHRWDAITALAAEAAEIAQATAKPG